MRTIEYKQSHDLQGSLWVPVDVMSTATRRVWQIRRQLLEGRCKIPPGRITWGSCSAIDVPRTHVEKMALGLDLPGLERFFSWLCQQHDEHIPLYSGSFTCTPAAELVAFFVLDHLQGRLKIEGPMVRCMACEHDVTSGVIRRKWSDYKGPEAAGGGDVWICPQQHELFNRLNWIA